MKNYEVVMIVECEEEATKYIAQSVCDGLELPTAVKHINIEEYKQISLKHLHNDDEWEKKQDEWEKKQMKTKNK